MSGDPRQRNPNTEALHFLLFPTRGNKRPAMQTE